MKRHAELLKVKFGSALASECQENEVVCIPGLRGREPKEISVRNLASIIQARMEEIIEHVYYEIKNSGFEKKLIGGIVVTGGGAQLKHITQLFEYITGMDARIGYPNEHLAATTTVENVTSPMYATGIGLVVKGFAGTLRATETVVEEKHETEKTTASATVKNHSTKTKGGFFDKILSKSRTWFEEED